MRPPAGAPLRMVVGGGELSRPVSTDRRQSRRDRFRRDAAQKSQVVFEDWAAEAFSKQRRVFVGSLQSAEEAFVEHASREIASEPAEMDSVLKPQFEIGPLPSRFVQRLGDRRLYCGQLRRQFGAGGTARRRVEDRRRADFADPFM